VIAKARSLSENREKKLKQKNKREKKERIFLTLLRESRKKINANK